MSHILVTGGAGYIGTTLVPMLLDKGHRVTVYDSLLYGGQGLLLPSKSPRFTFIKGDVRDLSSLKKAAENTQTVIHLAALVGAAACANFSDASSVNYDGSANIGFATAEQKQRILYASTVSIYGKNESICYESTEINPISNYGMTKAMAETFLRQSGRCTALRLATAYGVSPRMRLDLLVNDLAYRAVTQDSVMVFEPDFARPFTSVTDIARAFCFCLEEDKTKNQIFNVSTENMTKRMVGSLIQTMTGTPFHMGGKKKDVDQRNYQVSTDKLYALGYTGTEIVMHTLPRLIKSMSLLNIRNPYTNA